jgi:hypothetical protein
MVEGDVVLDRYRSDDLAQMIREHVGALDLQDDQPMAVGSRLLVLG